MNKVLFIVGPTASGKTSLAFDLAKNFDGELVSCDSVQVYKNLDIVSGKDVPPDSPFIRTNAKFTGSENIFETGYYLVNNIPIHLLDAVSPFYSFNIYDYINIATPVIGSIQQKDKLPIVVGGTAFYIKALLDGVQTLDIPQNQELRAKLEKKTVDELVDILKRENRERFAKMNESDSKNKRRLIRAVEVAEHSSKFKMQSSKLKRLDNVGILMIGLCADREMIKKRIDDRVDIRLKNGAVEEVKSLFGNYKKLSNQVKTANGYRQLFEYFLGEVSFDDAVNNWKKAEYNNAKKQVTFFKKNKNIKWFDISKNNFEDEIKDFVSCWCFNK